jgi:hypothetical protein
MDQHALENNVSKPKRVLAIGVISARLVRKNQRYIQPGSDLPSITQRKGTIHPQDESILPNVVAFLIKAIFYLVGETDVGGFGMGSDISFQAYGGVGCELIRNLFSEIGYRFLYDDFRDENVGYLYQLSTHGVRLKIGLGF